MLTLSKIPWKYRIWVLLAGAVFTIWLANGLNPYLGIGLAILYLILFPPVVWKQFIKK